MNRTLERWLWIFTALFAALALCGCGATGSAKGGGTSVERTIEQPTTRTTTIDMKGIPPDQWQVFADLWRSNPPQRGAR